MTYRAALLIFASAALASCWEPGSANAGGAQVDAADSRFPALTGRVVDQASLLTPGQEMALSSKSAALEAMTGRQFVVVTVNSLSGQDVATFTRDLGNHWRIGRKGENDGVILLVAPNEKKVRIAVGRGLERTLTDEIAGVIIRDDILPRFRAGEIEHGIMAGADAVITQLSLPIPPAASRQFVPARHSLHPHG